MARIRSVHPGLWTDEQFVACSPLARLLLIGLWNEADDQGVFEWKPVSLKMRLLPMDNVDVTELLGELTAVRAIGPFQMADKRYGAIRNFRKFQRPKSPNATHPLPPDLRSYVGLSEASGETGGDEVPSFPPKGEKSPQMEDGGDKRKEEGVKKDGTVVPSEEKPASRGTRLAAEWQPVFDTLQFSAVDSEATGNPPLTAGEIEREMARFRDYWLGKAGKDACKADWNATLRNWLRKSADDKQNRKAAFAARHNGNADKMADAISTLRARARQTDAGPSSFDGPSVVRLLPGARGA
jgi:hypothetical protein